MRLPLGTTGESLLLHGQFVLSTTLSSTVTSWCELHVSCADVGLSHSAATSSSKSCPQVTQSAISPQVQTGSTRTVTSDLLSATLTEAATQLSFAAFLARCISVCAPPPPRYPSPRHFWMPPPRLFHTSLSPRTFLHNSRLRSSLLDLSTRTIPRGPWLHRLRTLFSTPRVPDPSLRYFLTRLCRRHLTMPPHNNRSRSSSPGVSSPMTLQRLTSTTRRQCYAFAVPAAPATQATVTSTLRPHACHYSRLQVSGSMPTCAPHIVYLLKRHRCDLVYRSSGNPQPCWCSPSCRNWSFSYTTSNGSSHGEIWAIRTCRAWSH